VIERTFVNPKEAEYEAPGGPWHGQTLPRLLLEAHDRPDLYVDDHGVIGTSALIEKVRRVAGALRARGVRRGDAVAWQLPNRTDAAVLYWATWWLGAVAVPMHAQLTDREIAAVLDAVGGAHVVDGDVAQLDGDPVDHDPAVSSGDVAVVITTSGSSGTPKSVIHTHRTQVHKARQFAVVHGTGPDDAILVPAPLAHSAGVLHGVLHPVATGIKAVIMERWDPDHALELIEREQITMLFGPPVFALGITASEHFTSEKVASVRLIASGGTTITEDFSRDMAARFGAVVKRTYGSTEMPVVTTSYPGDPLERCYTSEGRLVPDAELELRDGEVWVRGPELAEGYIDRDQTASAFVDGWFRTWDVGVLDDGWLRIVGRLADIIIRGGANVSAAEVEGVLERHPAVRQAVVVGYPDPVYGERIGAFVVTDEAIDRDWCVAWFAEAGLAKYKVPDRVEVVDAIPVLATFQKPDRAQLRARMAGLADPGGPAAPESV
jgi:acyl-CoA synthetase (AMP-forming)/AMP-acid ligase II